MSIELRTFASGDTDYISKLNSNVSTLTAAINGLQAQAGAVGAGTPLSTGAFLMSVFNNADGLIGVAAYKPVQSATTILVGIGGMYLAASQTIVASYVPVTLNLIGQTPGTKYIVVDSGGFPTLQDTSSGSGAAYSIQWDGTSFSGQPIRLAPAFYDTIEAEASRKSTVLGTNYLTLDARLEAGELRAKSAQDDADNATDIANDVKDRLEEVIAATGAQKFRKVGVTVDGIPGNKGAIQLDFYGKIVGWSVIADKVGDLQVEVSKKASLPPPQPPQIPNIAADRISAAFPVQLSAAQTAARADAGVSSWTTVKVTPWDVIQFYTTLVSTITRATLYLRIQEEPPIQPVVGAFIDSTSVAVAPLLIS
jgi:hypothetical protein